MIYTILFLDVLVADRNESFKIFYFHTSKNINLLVYASLVIIIVISLIKAKKYEKN